MCSIHINYCQTCPKRINFECGKPSLNMVMSSCVEIVIITLKLVVGTLKMTCASMTALSGICNSSAGRNPETSLLRQENKLQMEYHTLVS